MRGGETATFPAFQITFPVAMHCFSFSVSMDNLVYLIFFLTQPSEYLPIYSDTLQYEFIKEQVFEKKKNTQLTQFPKINKQINNQ